jgi:hypothetical protein
MPTTSDAAACTAPSPAAGPLAPALHEVKPDRFRKACEFGLEGAGVKAKRPYRGSRSKHWIKVKNRRHHAFERVMEASHDRRQAVLLVPGGWPNRD